MGLEFCFMGLEFFFPKCCGNPAYDILMKLYALSSIIEYSRKKIKSKVLDPLLLNILASQRTVEFTTNCMIT